MPVGVGEERRLAGLLHAFPHRLDKRMSAVDAEHASRRLGGRCGRRLRRAVRLGGVAPPSLRLRFRRAARGLWRRGGADVGEM